MKESEQRDRFLVDEMLTHVDVMERIVAEGRSEFLDPTNAKSRYAVQHATELLAEACERVSHRLKTANSDIPWRSLQKYRHDIAHPYDTGAQSVNAEEVWRFAAHDLPRIARELRRAKFPKDFDA